MKIERPGKACAVTPCTDIEGPMVILDNGEFRRVDAIEDWNNVKERVVSIWDNGEILMGFGEFLENNKSLVPSAYNRDWWAADLAESLDQPGKVIEFAEIMGLDVDQLPSGLPFNGAVSRGGEDTLERDWRKRAWYVYLRDLELDWVQSKSIGDSFGTAVPPPWNLWWSDLPISVVSPLTESLIGSSVGEEGLRISGASEGWGSDSSFVSDLSQEPDFDRWPSWMSIEKHGIIKSALLTLGLAHLHSNGDIIIPRNWEGLLEGLGLINESGVVNRSVDSADHIEDRLGRIKRAKEIVGAEGERLRDLERRRGVARVRATTVAMQEGKGTLETEAIGDRASEAIQDSGPADAAGA